MIPSAYQETSGRSGRRKKREGEAAKLAVITAKELKANQVQKVQKPEIKTDQLPKQKLNVQQLVTEIKPVVQPEKKAPIRKKRKQTCGEQIITKKVKTQKTIRPKKVKSAKPEIKKKTKK